MLLRSLFIFILLCCSSSLWAQYKVVGTLADTANLSNMGYSSISIMSSSDSVLQDYGRADENGKFELNVSQKGEYFIRFSNPAFTTFVSDINIKNAVTDLDTVHMITLQNLLDEVIVRDSRPITIKGDTVEFNADSFKVREFATVDELLKKLPGIEIDRNGKITSQGQKVSRMLVDGDEFFSDDPAVVSKMLKASAIDKVQVFDSKSEEAKITGIEDSEKSKTINLTLKENAKQGYMGKVEAGAGLPNFYEGQAMVNAYKNKRKLAAYIIGSNTNNQGLGWNESSTYGSGNNSFMSDDGIFYSTYTSDETGVGSDGRFGGQGLPKSLNGGISYNNKYGKDDKWNISGNYRFNDFRNDARVSNRTQYFMPDTQYVNNSQNQKLSRSVKNNASGRVELKIDSTSNINIKVNGGIAQNTVESSSHSDYTTISGQKINESNSQNQSKSNNYNADIDLNYSKRFLKKGRSFTANFKGNYMQKLGETDFSSNNQFYNNNTEVIFNQEKRDSALNLNAAVRFTYTEPIVEDKIFVTVNAGSDYTQNDAVLSTYDKDANGNISTQNQLYSTDMTNTIFNNSIGSTLRYTDKIWYATVGGNVRFTDYQNTNNFNGLNFQRNFVNFFPQATIRYSKKRSSSVSLSYNGSTNQPRIDQIQVMVQNTDPLNIRIGNQNLVQEFRHSFSTNFNTYKMMTEQYTYGNISFSFVDNAFSEARNINNEGVNTFQTINIDGNWNLSGWLGYGFNIKPIDTRVSFNVGGNYSNQNSILNSLLNNSKNLGLNFGMDAYYDQDTGLSVSYSINPSYNLNQTSVNVLAKNRYWMTTQNMELSYKFSKGLEIGTTINWLLREKMDDNDKNNNVFIANAFIQQSFLKDKSLILGIHGNDIFNQNIGFNRSNYSNYITETTYNNIRRYFMLKLSWNFNKTKASKANNDNTETIDLGF